VTSRAYSPAPSRVEKHGSAGLSLLIPACSPPEPANRAPDVPRDFADGTLRLHWRQWRTGGVERFTLERLRYEQAWPGRRTRLTDGVDWGDYRLSVYDPEREALIFRQGFDTNLRSAVPRDDPVQRPSAHAAARGSCRDRKRRAGAPSRDFARHDRPVPGQRGTRAW
jgi:hypothetical protein